MADLVTLKIDGIEVSAPKGMFILEAARRAGIVIPNYCAHPDLRPWGECRMCTVEVQTRRGRWTEIACSTSVQDGMEVFTNTKRIRDTRRFLLEGMFIHHPLECPICDKSGECDLQSMGYEYEVPAANPFRRPKLAWEYDYLSAAITLKRDRCVQCGRCIRVCDEVIGAKALAFVRRGEDMYVSTPWEQTLIGSTNCTSCGLCVQVCPVGALLYSPTKDTIRAWELTRTPSVCPHCSVGCAMKLQVERHTGFLRRIIADREEGPNDARLCVKGRFGWEFVQHPDRLTTPLIRRDGRLEPATWEEALAVVVERLAANAGDRFGAIASARLTNEELYLLQKLCRAALGTNNVDTSARLADLPAVHGLLDTLGVPGWQTDIYDLKDNAGLVMLIGANIADSQPVLWYMLQESMRRRDATLIVVDPRPIPPNDIAAEWVRLRPGTDIAFLNGLAHLGLRDGLVVRTTVADLADGLAALEAAVAAYTPERVSEITGVPVAQLERVARLYFTGGAGSDGRRSDGSFPSSAIVAGSGLTAWAHGTDAIRACANLAVLSGNVGRPGSGVLPVRRDANGQGATDMGAAPEFLPGYRHPDDADARAALESLWFLGLPGRALPTSPGLTYVDMIEAAERGSLGALWILGEDVVRAAPDPERTRRALRRLDCLVVSELFLTETAQLAHAVLPSAAWAEKAGTYTNHERRVQALHPAAPPPDQPAVPGAIARGARPEWEQIAAVSTRLGYEMRYLSPADVLEEIARVTPIYADVRLDQLARTIVRLTPKPGLVYGDRTPLVIERAGQFWRAENPSVLSPAFAPASPNGGSAAAPATGTAAVPTSPPATASTGPMPTSAGSPNGSAGVSAPGANGSAGAGGAGTGRSRLRLRPVEQTAPPLAPDADFPLTLVVAGTLYHAGLGVETGHCGTLESLDLDGFVGLAPAVAERLGVGEGDRVTVASRHGRLAGPAHIVQNLPAELVWIPPHYPELPVAALFDPATRDPETRTPALKAVPVAVAAGGGAR